MKLKLIYLLAFLLYSPSLFNYFSHDDFFNLQLAKISSLTDFWRFFDLFHAPERVGSFRPLTTQVYFLISWIFNLSPYPLHIIAFIVFFADIYLVYKLARILLTNEKSSLIAAFLYAVSATHFAHLYWPSIFQETGLIFFFLSSVILFLKNRYFFSFLAMIGALMSKETAIMIPIVLTLTGRQFKKLIPFYLATGIFLFIHLYFYGLPPGNVYKMDFSLKILNTLSWYLLWSFNLPELFVDYLGPGLHLNLNLINFYGREAVAIMFFFLTTIISLFFVFKKINLKLIIFCLGWFLITLMPVIFLPWHKFTYELGIPLVGIALILASLLAKTKTKIAVIFCLGWFLTSVSTNFLTYKTHWITQGPKISEKVKKYFQNNSFSLNKNLVFYDTPKDASLPWGPANEIKINLSNQDFFTVYYPGKFQASYLKKIPEVSDKNTSYINARQFMGY